MTSPVVIIDRYVNSHAERKPQLGPDLKGPWWSFFFFSKSVSVSFKKLRTNILGLDNVQHYKGVLFRLGWCGSLVGPAHPGGRDERGKGREEKRDGLDRFGPILFFPSLFFYSFPVFFYNF